MLETKLVVGDIIIRIDTEFVDNQYERVEKQDCELRVFYRIAKRIKKEYSKRSIIRSGDALYACKKVMTVCKNSKQECN